MSLESYPNSLVNGTVRKASLALFGASALLWLIACVNVASLMLARSRRGRESLPFVGRSVRVVGRSCSRC